MNVGVVGTGYWGKQVARNLDETPDVYIAAVAEPDDDLRRAACDRFCLATSFGQGERLICEADILNLDAVAITTPVETHYELGRAALLNGLHVLMAKPLAATVSEAETLAALAKEHDRVLLVDHTFVYAPPVTELAASIREYRLGDVWHVSSTRTNLGLVRPDVDVVWDLAPHDLSIIREILDPIEITHVACVGSDSLGYGRVSVAHLTCWLDGHFLATVEVSWLSPVKVRRMVVTGAQATAVWDDTDPSEPLKLYDRGIDGVDPDTARASYRSGPVLSPHVDRTEALALECAHFAACCRGECAPMSGPDEGVAVVRMLEAASRSLSEGGVKVPVYG